jgi:hypothetical protein
MGTPKKDNKVIILASSFAITAFTIAAVLMLSLSVSNTAAQPSMVNNTTTTNATKPVDGYDDPKTHINAVRHVFDDPSLRVEHYCKPNDKIVVVCQLYDSDLANATLIGIEYIITQEQYDSLPDREKPYWHAHGVEFSPDRADPMMSELSPEEAKAQMAMMAPTLGKVIITWNPNDEMPSFPPQVQLVDHPFVLNATVTSTANATISSNGTGQ